MPLIYWNNKLLFRNGKIALDIMCCCNNCFRACLIVSFSYNGEDNSVFYEPIPQPSKHGESKLVWHATSWGPTNQPPEVQYRLHMYVIAFKWKRTDPFGVPERTALDWYRYDLNQWIGGLCMSIENDPVFCYGTDFTQLAINCLSETEIQRIRDEILDISGVVPDDPYTFEQLWTTADIYGPESGTPYEECQESSS